MPAVRSNNEATTGEDFAAESLNLLGGRRTIVIDDIDRV